MLGILSDIKDSLVYWSQLLIGITIERFMGNNRSLIGYADKTQYIPPQGDDK
jgi:hypothetical protein